MSPVTFRTFTRLSSSTCTIWRAISEPGDRQAIEGLHLIVTGRRGPQHGGEIARSGPSRAPCRLQITDSARLGATRFQHIGNRSRAEVKSYLLFSTKDIRSGEVDDLVSATVHYSTEQVETESQSLLGADRWRHRKFLAVDDYIDKRRS